MFRKIFGDELWLKQKLSKTGNLTSNHKLIFLHFVISARKVDMTKPLFVDMTKPLFSVSHLALHSFGHHHPAWLPPPPSPRGAWSPTSFPRGVTTAFLFINPISPCYCIIAFLPSLTSKGGTRASQRTICEFPGQLALLAMNTGQSIELLLGRSSSPH